MNSVIPHFSGSFSEFLSGIYFILFLSGFLMGSFVWVCLIIRTRKALFLTWKKGESNTEPQRNVSFLIGTGRTDCTIESGTAAYETGYGAWLCIKSKGVLFF